MRMRGYPKLIAVVAITSALQGCGGASGGDPGAKSLPLGASCQSIRGEMSRLEGRGVQSAIERQQAGSKVSASQKADADNYNSLLNQYLGARCHV